MSSTRTSTTGEFNQERFCSAPEFQGGIINARPAAMRIALIKNQAVREALWFIQWRSISPGGLQQLCDDLVKTFPERIGSPTLRKLARSKRTFLETPEVQALRKEYGLTDDLDINAFLGRESSEGPIPFEEFKLRLWRSRSDDAMRELPERLKQFCVDPRSDITKGVLCFDDLFGALIALRDRFAAQARSRLAETAVTARMTETLDFCKDEQSMVLIEGVAGIGKSVAASTWADSQCGLVRLVEVPSSSDDRSFFAAIARSLGVARGMSMKSQEIKVRIEETLLDSTDLLLAFDESQYLWGQYTRPRKTPDRLLWIKSILDAGTPVALIAHSDFSRWQAHYVKQTLWSDEQFERRLNRRVVLPVEHSREDMLKIARTQFPGGDPRCWSLLAAYALGTDKKQASGIVEALKSARFRAKKTGRDRVVFADIEAALIHDHAFGDMLAAAALQRAGTAIAKPVKPPRNVQPDTTILLRDRGRLGRLSVSL